MKHDLSGHCGKCLEIFDRYSGFYQPLKGWFIDLQLKYPELHISCAGRGKADQEACFLRGASKARYLHSAHNFNAGIDTFFLIDGKAEWPRVKYDLVIAPNLRSDLKWYGAKDAEFYELPHIEVMNWRMLQLSPVE